MRPRRLPFLALALFLASPAVRAQPAPPVFEDLRLLVRFHHVQITPFIDDIEETTITIYRGGALRYLKEIIFARGDGCDRSTFALGKGTQAQVQTVDRALTAARIGQIPGRCTSAAGGGQYQWIGPFGDRSNVVDFGEGPPSGPPPCPAELFEAGQAIRAFAAAVLGQAETAVLQGQACYPSRL